MATDGNVLLKKITQLLKEFDGKSSQNYIDIIDDWSILNDIDSFCVFKIPGIFDISKSESIKRVEGIISSLRQSMGYNIIYILFGDKANISLYFGIVKNQRETKFPYSNAERIGKGILQPGLESLLCASGSNMSLSSIEKQDILEKISKMSCCGYLTGIADFLDNEDQRTLNYVIDVMGKEEFAIVVIAQPCIKSELEDIERSLVLAEYLLEKEIRKEDNTPNEYALNNWHYFIKSKLISRIRLGKNRGLFWGSCFLCSKNTFALHRLKNALNDSIVQPNSSCGGLLYHSLDMKDEICKKHFNNLQIPCYINRYFNRDSLASLIVKGELGETEIRCASWMSCKEVANFMRLPDKETQGFFKNSYVNFGLNVSNNSNFEEQIFLGNLITGSTNITNLNILDKYLTPVFLNKRYLNTHTFITGVTGSGKTTTCQNVLINSNFPFLVIEPAKTEYRILKNQFQDLVVFTLGKQDVSPFYLNPFEISKGESITSRASMLKAAFEASFDMDAAIPQIMEAAIYRVYKNKGWNINNNLWNGLGENDEGGPFNEGVFAFPTITDYLEALKEITEEQGFDDRLKDEYIGSINARFQSLLLGAKGQMLDTPKSIDFDDLVKPGSKVIIEMEEIRDGAEKSLIMGLILINVMQAVKRMYLADETNSYRHITLIEEAHRLLGKFTEGDSRNKRQGIEVFTDMLAEVRKYGESFIIVDQIPNKMTPEILKNTNTKIVHKIFAQDDKDVIGDAMALSEEQKAYLSNLPTGRCIVISQGWDKPLQVQVNKKSFTDEKPPSDEEIRKIAWQYYARPKVFKRGVFPGLEQKDSVTENDVKQYIRLMQQGKEWIFLLKEYCDQGITGHNSKEKYQEMLNGLKQALQVTEDDDLIANFALHWLNLKSDKDGKESLFDLLRAFRNNDIEGETFLRTLGLMHTFC